jgi:ABC-type transporter Mla maintaining outer membrane lipid asymmetry permease subunit MlaE
VARLLGHRAVEQFGRAIIAGRTGAGFAAELGSMKITNAVIDWLAALWQI